MIKYQISKDWIGSGCKDIIHKIWIEGDEVDWLKADKVNWIEVTWLEAIIRSHLKNRPEDEVWFDVKWFLQKYFLILEYKEYIPSKKQREKTEINPNLKIDDVLIEELSADYVKSLYKGKSYKELSMFLIYINDLKYFKITLHEPALNIIGKNSFDPGFNFRRENKPPDNPQDYPLLKYIPTNPKSFKS